MPNNNINTIDIKLRSEEVQEILEATPSWMIRWGNILVLSLIVMLLFISWFVKYPDVIPSNAIITTELPPQKEYAKTRRKITAILVKENDTVDAGTPLAILENTANYKDVLLLKSIVDTVSVTNTSFSFPFDKLPLLFLGDIDSHFALFENSYLQYQLNKQYQPFSNEVSTNQITKLELTSRLKLLKSQRKTSLLELTRQEEIFNRNKVLYEKGVIAKQDLEQAEIAYAQAKRNFTNMDISISNLKEAIANANNTSRTTNINKTREEIGLLKAVIQSFNQLKRALKDWELQHVLLSNIDGKVVFLNSWAQNQTVNQGDQLFIIVPKKNSTYIAKLKSPAQNSGKIKVGQIVNIKLQNYPDTEFGTLQGRIESIVLFPDEEGEYLVTVKLPEVLITSYKKVIPFQHEMLGTAEIITEDLRLMDRFFQQLKTVID